MASGGGGAVVRAGLSWHGNERRLDRRRLPAAGRGQQRRRTRDLDVDRNRTSDLQVADLKRCRRLRPSPRSCPLPSVETGLFVEKSPEMMFRRRASSRPSLARPDSENAVFPPQLALADPRQRPAPPSSATLLVASPVSEPRLNLVSRFVLIRVAVGSVHRLSRSAVPPPTTLNPSHGSSASSPLKSPTVLVPERSFEDRCRGTSGRAIELERVPQCAVQGGTDASAAAGQRPEMNDSWSRRIRLNQKRLPREGPNVPFCA